MRTVLLLVFSLSVLMSSPGFAQRNPGKTLRETIIIKRSGDNATTIDISDNGIYVNGERVATREEVNNKNMTKRIIIEDETSRSSGTRSYEDYYNSGGTNDNTGRRALLGVYSAPSRYNDGARIQSLTPNSPAEKGGLRAGDVITRVDTAKVYSAEDLTRIIMRYNPGDRVTVSYSRNGRDRQTTVRLGETPADGWSRLYENDSWLPPIPEPFIDREESTDRPKLGISVEELADEKGVRILDIRPNTPAEKAGLKEDDVITSIDGMRVGNLDDLQRIVGNLRAGNGIRLQIIRGNDRISKMVNIPKPKEVRDF